MFTLSTVNHKAGVQRFICTDVFKISVFRRHKQKIIALGIQTDTVRNKREEEERESKEEMVEN